MMPPAPRVSIVIAVRNGAAVIGDLLQSLRRLRFTPGEFEIIVVDN